MIQRIGSSWSLTVICLWVCVISSQPGASAHGQVLDALSDLLNQAKTPNQPSTSEADELPAPNKSSVPAADSQKRLSATQKSSDDTAPTNEAAPGQRSYLGLEAEQPTEGLGVQVAVVHRDSPAWKAGFKVNDRILGVQGFAIGKMEDMIEQLGKARPGQSVNFLINRDGRNLELVAVLMNAELADQIRSNTDTSNSELAWLGVTAHDLTNSFRDQFGIGAFRGAAVTQVVNGSPAHQAGIRPGDAVIEVSGRPIESAADLHRWVEQSKPGDAGQVVYYRGAGRKSTKLVLTADPQQQPQVATPARSPTKPPSSSLATAQRPPVVDTEPAISLPPATNQPLPQAGRPLPDSPLVLLPPQADSNSEPSADSSSSSSQRERELEAEITALRKELEDVKKKLTDTKKQLDNILRALKE